MRFQRIGLARLTLIIAMAIALGVGATACGGDDGDGGGDDAAATQNGEGTGSLEGNGEEMVLFTMTASNIYGAVQIEGARQMAEQLGYELKVFQNNFSQPEQDQQVQQYVATGAEPAAALIFPWVADAAVNAIRQLSEIAPVIMITQEPDEQTEPFVEAYAGANQQLIGRVAGEMLMEARDAAREEGMELTTPEGNLLIFQHPEGEKTGVEREKGYEEVMAEEPFNVIHTEWGPNDPETGYEIGSQVIPRFKNEGIDFIYVSNQQAANGIIRALKENDIRPGRDVKIVSSDCSGSLEAVENSETFGTGLQSGAIEGMLGVATAAQFIATGTTEDDAQQYEVEPEQPEFEAVPPAFINYMPHAPAVGPEGIADTQIWGLTAEEICAGG